MNNRAQAWLITWTLNSNMLQCGFCKWSVCFFVGSFLGSNKRACKMLKLWVLKFDRVDTWRAAAAGAFPPFFNCTQLPPGVILCAKHWLSSLGLCDNCSRNKTRLEMEFTGFNGWLCLVFDLFPIELKSLSLILNRPMICNLADLHNCFYTLLKEQLVRLYCHLLLTLVDLAAILSWNCLWGFVSLWKTAVSCIQVLEYVGEKTLSLQDDALHLHSTQSQQCKSLLFPLLWMGMDCGEAALAL